MTCFSVSLAGGGFNGVTTDFLSENEAAKVVDFKTFNESFAKSFVN